jgi:intein-encoded DNA endonuclease-like protein
MAVNQKFFQTWSPEMAYVLGFFMADGSMSKNKRGAYFFSIQICDNELLYAIRESLESAHKISASLPKGKEKIKYRLQIGSKQICLSLRALGIEFRKAHTLSMPDVPKGLLGDFVRGYFDGDGNVWVGLVHKERVHSLPVLFTAFTSCSKGFLESLQKVLIQKGMGKGSLVSLKSGAYYRLQYSIKDSLQLACLMYEMPLGSLYLKRKKDIFDVFKSIHMRA